MAKRSLLSRSPSYNDKRNNFPLPPFLYRAKRDDYLFELFNCILILQIKNSFPQWGLFASACASSNKTCILF